MPTITSQRRGDVATLDRWDFAVEKPAPPIFFVSCGCGATTCTRHPVYLRAQGWSFTEPNPASYVTYVRLPGICPECSHTKLQLFTCQYCHEPVEAVAELLIMAGWVITPERVLCVRCANFVRNGIQAQKAIHHESDSKLHA